MGLSAAVALSAAALFLRSDAWFEDYRPNEPRCGTRGTQTGDPCSPDRFSDWLLWEIPGAAWTMSYDVRFSSTTSTSSMASRSTTAKQEPTAKSFADGYRIIVVDDDDPLAHP